MRRLEQEGRLSKYLQYPEVGAAHRTQSTLGWCGDDGGGSGGDGGGGGGSGGGVESGERENDRANTFFLPHLKAGFLTRRSFDRLPFVSEHSVD